MEEQNYLLEDAFVIKKAPLTSKSLKSIKDITEEFLSTKTGKNTNYDSDALSAFSTASKYQRLPNGMIINND